MLLWCLSAAIFIPAVFAPGISSDFNYNYHGFYRFGGGAGDEKFGQNLGVNEYMAQAHFAGQLALAGNDSNWSTWAICSRKCDEGIGNQFKTVYNTTTCNSSLLLKYKSCDSSINCCGIQTADLKAISLIENSNYAYSTCYFVDNTTIAWGTSTSDTVCDSQSAISAALYAPDFALKRGSEFLQSAGEQALVALQYTSAGMEWIQDGQRYPLLDNSINSTSREFYACKKSPGTEQKMQRLDSFECNLSLARQLFMRTGHAHAHLGDIYSSYEAKAGLSLIEQESPEQITFELDAHACGARCGRTISCLGFNYNSNDQSCIPTKVSFRTPEMIDGQQICNIIEDEAWTFYDRS